MKRTLLLSCYLIYCLGCNTEGEHSNQSGNIDVSTQSAEIVLSVETDEIIAGPTLITAFDDGFILYDDAEHKIHLFSETGAHLNSFGRGGRGPGEFQSVSTITYDAGKIIVSDSKLLRLTSFDLKGSILTSHDLTASLSAMANTILSPHAFITPTNGHEGGLAKFVDRENDTKLVFGEPVTTPPEAVDFNQWQRDLSSGKVPDFFKNNVAVSGDDSSFYIFLQTQGLLQKFDVQGELDWEKKFNLPEFQDEYDRFVEQNKDNPPGRMYMLQYVYKMEQNEDGIYMLLRIPHTYPPTMLFLDHDEDSQRKIQFVDMGHRPSRFSISPDGKWIYLLNRSRGIVYRSSVPDEY